MRQPRRSPRNAIAALAALLLIALVVAGCGGGSSDSDSSPSAAVTTSAATTPPATTPADTATTEPTTTGATPPADTTSSTTSTDSSSSRSSSGDAAAGRTVFTSNCATCHTLSDAGATGTVGPNLDQLRPAMAAVARQVTNGGGGMPAFRGQLSDTQITDVATYVSTVAGR